MNYLIKYVQLPFSFSEEKLVKDLNSLNEKWILHFNKAHYEGEWGALPLRSLGGSMVNVVPGFGGEEVFADTPLMEQCPYIKSVLDEFKVEKKAIRLLNLKPGAVIKEHKDAELCYEQGEARIHIPILTNPQVEFYVDNERFEMLPGSCWYMNFNLPHRINNFGKTDRVHLVFDVVVNDYIRNLFENAPPERKKVIAEKDKFSVSQRRGIIEQLKGMNTPTSLAMAQKMEQELAEAQS